MTARSLAELGPEEKRALLKRLLAERAAAAAADAVGDHPLSHGQRALWFLQRLRPETHAYNVAFAARLRPGLDVPAFQRALDRLVARHAALRTAFPAVDETPVQRILPPSAVPLRVVEAHDASDDAVRATCLADARRPFELARPPLAVTLYRRAHEDTLLIVVHHIVVDGWSMPIALDDLRALYVEESGGAPAALPPVPARYVDFVASQERMLAGERGAALAAYWAETLAAPLPTLELASAPPRPSAVRMVGAHVPFSLGAELTAAVHRLARAQGTTLYTVLLAAMQCVLYELGRQPEVVIGCPVALRTASEFERVVGYFVNTVPVRGRVRPDESFAALLLRAREQVLGALAHQDYPFALMVDRLQARREANRNPIYQVTLNLLVGPQAGEPSRALDDGDRPAIAFGTSRLTQDDVPQSDGQFELAVEVAEQDGVLHGHVRYQTDVYDPATVHEVRDTLHAVLAAATAAPDRPVGELLGPGAREEFEL